MSALDAAAKLLAETGEAMNFPDLIKGMAEKGYWTSPGLFREVSLSVRLEH